ncbi:long-chain-fatty-acid--CoA ligase [Acuticoccus sp. I52.16.1]|uniref:long-chain-fatty-acid--CoA ligase n=1 Tax=Acuticoccus sp. I52.16.1 TaxID=2928472 RepID=UPI001FD3B5EE|nr:long-chain-fatty-acid--CoA ligase [Acuticoccus sp. I52.16.1]UOM34740.1 long-chain-fatty-acid--CoA ligase [Acuticoccus sp. I52.16.1]
MFDHDALSTIGTLARENARRAPGRACNVFEGRTTTFAAFDAHCDRIANAFTDLAARRVAYLGKNCDTVFEVLVGAARAGVLFAPVNWRLAPPEVAAILADFAPQVLFVGPECAEAVAAIRGRLPPGLTLIAMEGGHPQWPAFDAWRDASRAEAHPDRGRAGEPVLVLFTSGTTGLPKGAMLSHDNLFGQRRHTPATLTYDHWNDDDVSLTSMPVAHIAGSGWWMLGFVNACTNIITREFDPGAIIAIIARERVSKLFLVPAALQLIVRHPEAIGTDFRCVDLICYGAAPMPLALLREAITLIGCDFLQCYGLTETTGTVAMLLPAEHTADGAPRMRSAGRAAPGSQIRIVGPHGETLPPGAIGEVAIRGTAVMLGYLDKPDATAQVLGRDGWFRSGDAGYLDEDGFLYIHDRIKDMIITGGENVYPAEVENAIFGHPDVDEVAVIGVPDEVWGEAVKAIVAPRPGHVVDREAVLAWTRERLAAFKCPKTIDIVDALPRNAAGKVLRRELRRPYWAVQERQVH